MLRRAHFILVIAAAVVVALSSAAFFSGFPGRRLARPFYLGGIQINEPDPTHWVTTLKASGMNTVEATVYAKQGDWNSDDLWYDDANPGVLAEIRAARAAGLQVVLILRVALDHAFPRNKFLWHGMIMPRSDTLLASWFEKYQAFVLKWAAIAEREDVDVLVVGSEMNALSATLPNDILPDLLDHYSRRSRQQKEKRKILKFAAHFKETDLWVRGFSNYRSAEEYLADQMTACRAWATEVMFGDPVHCLPQLNARNRRLNQHWLQLIAATRQAFHGQLSYAANFDNYHAVGFWHALDLIGINAYFPLRDPDRQTDSAAELRRMFEAGWAKVFADIKNFKRRQQIDAKPVLFTELGYLYRRDTTIEPWSGFGFSVVGSENNERLIVWKEQPIDRQERALAVEALHQVVRWQPEVLAGILYWKLTTNHDHLAIEPFALPIAVPAIDPLQTSLARFGSR